MRRRSSLKLTSNCKTSANSSLVSRFAFHRSLPHPHAQVYAHSTAPNRRFPDLITQRLLKAAVAGSAPPYDDELEALAKHCTEAEDAAKKVERQVIKSAAAILLETRIGEDFNAIVTGASVKGTWVRLLNPPVEGRLVSGIEGKDVGQRLRVQLIRTVVERGFIDFKTVLEATPVARSPLGHP